MHEDVVRGTVLSTATNQKQLLNKMPLGRGQYCVGRGGAPQLSSILMQTNVSGLAGTFRKEKEILKL